MTKRVVKSPTREPDSGLGKWRKKPPAAPSTGKAAAGAATHIEATFLPHDPDGHPLTGGEKAWLLKRVATATRKLNELGLAEALPPSWTLHFEKGFADQAGYNPLSNTYKMRVSQHLLTHEDETVFDHELGHLVTQLVAKAPLSSHHHLNEALGDVLSSMMTGKGYIGSPEYRAASGLVGTDEGAAMRYVTDLAAKGMPRAIGAGNARTLASLSYEGDSHEGSVLTTRFLFDVREAPTVGKDFNRLLLDTMADLGRWTYDEAGQRPREVFRDKVYSMFGANRLERTDAIFDFHLMTAFLMRNAKSDEQRGVILQGFEARGGQERLLNQVLEWVNGAAARKKERIASSPLNQALNQMDFSSVRAARPLTRGEAERLAAEWSKKFKASISVDWENPAIGMSVSPSRPVSIPRGLIEYPGITADGLALLVSHEMAHVRGIMDEAAADDYAARHGLRLLWGDAAFAKGIPERAFKAAYSVLLKWSQLADNAFSVVTAEPVRLVNERGTEYLSLQSRWDVFREGFMGRPTSVMRN